MTSPRLYHLALRELHTRLGATFVEASGWLLPGTYGDPAAEYAAVRSGAACFDDSSRSRFLLSGTDAGEVLARTFAGHVNELEEGRAMRTAALAGDGTIGDLVLIARTGGIAYLVSGEPGRREWLAAALRANRDEDYDVRVDDRTETTTLLGVAGPAAEDVIHRGLAEGLPARLQTLHAVTFEFHGFRALAIRTSATGEDGFAFMFAPAVAQHAIETLTEAGTPVAGRTALESLRIEACVPAFDPDLLPGLTPAEADLDQLLDLPGGADSRILTALLLDGPPQPAGTVITRAGEPCGELRSCAHGFGVRSTAGLGLLEARVAAPGVALDVGGVPATIVGKPIYRRRG
ncbi:MAG: hypothetical protein ACKVVT_10650 [Dehalococcoidia bacterium]